MRDFGQSLRGPLQGHRSSFVYSVKCVLDGTPYRPATVAWRVQTRIVDALQARHPSAAVVRALWEEL